MCEKFTNRRVVITGLGAVTPLGLNADESWSAITAGKSGISLIEPEEDFRNSKVRIAGQIKNFDPLRYFTTKELKGTHRSVQLSTAATEEALVNAGLYADGKLRDVNPERVNIRIGSAVGGFTHIAEIENIIRNKGEHKISAFSALQVLLGRTSYAPSIKFGITGTVYSVDAECASGSIAITEAVDKILLRKADVVIAGGAEAPIHRTIIGAFTAANHALSTRNESPTEASRPFDKDADGFVLSEGSAILVLEDLEHARARGARIYAEILGYGNTADAYHPSLPSGKGAVKAMRLALNEGKINLEEVDYINPHGPSTNAGDGKEIESIKETANGNSGRLLISSTKSAVGHMLGGAGAFEALVCVKAIETGIVPPTLNLRNPIEEAEGLDLVPLVARHSPINTALNNSFGLGGGCSSMLVRKYLG